MGFKRVRFNNFRNLESREMRWFPGLNLLTGENGVGKTNILEGINIIAGWGPLDRGTKALSIPTWNSGSSEARLTGELDGDEIIRVKIASRYTIRLDDKAVTASELRWKIPVLTFLPGDMSIVEGSSAFRRRLLDMLLALIVPPYAQRLSEYRRGIRQKGLFLKRGSPPIIADRALLPLAAWIWRMREEGVKLLSSCMESVSELAPAAIGLSLKRGGAGFEESCEDDYARALIINRERESAVRFPVVGPHRDDIIITADGRPAAEALSRGLRRRAAIALMLAASDGVRRKIGSDPVLLLDEVTAELDVAGRELLFDTLAKRNTQLFAATAEPFAGDFRCTVHRISSGKIVESYEK
ncbi:MAG: DNA replication and repair protein RecF [Synergistaceae bacterium]|nr:DNA replication and repair protein RecF [Synergistaceae bacterium]